MSADFVLDRTENPHPDMLARALQLRSDAIRGGRTAYTAWRFYRLCMCDATGETAEAIEQWMDRNAPTPPEPPVPTSGRTPVAVPVRRSRPDHPQGDGGES